MTFTTNQRADALVRANEIRLGRAELHRVIAAMSSKGGAQHVARLLEEPPDFLDSLPVRKFLLWIDHWGDARAERLLTRLDIGLRQDVTVGALTERQRLLLASQLLGGSLGNRYPVVEEIKHAA